MASMSGITIEVTMPRRSAEVVLPMYKRTELGLELGTDPVPCFVLGIFQEGNNYDGYDTYALCELLDGRIVYASPERVRFVDTELNRTAGANPVVTNFEYYKDAILRITNTGKNFALTDDTIAVCEDIPCALCTFHKKYNVPCAAAKYEWMCQEHK